MIWHYQLCLSKLLSTTPTSSTTPLLLLYYSPSTLVLLSYFISSFYPSPLLSQLVRENGWTISSPQSWCIVTPFAHPQKEGRLAMSLSLFQEPRYTRTRIYLCSNLPILSTHLSQSHVFGQLSNHVSWKFFCLSIRACISIYLSSYMSINQHSFTLCFWLYSD